MEVNRTNLAALNRGFQSVFNDAFAAAQPSWSDFAMEVPSMSSEETYGWLSSIPGFREWIGERVIQNLSTADYTIKNRTFEMTVGVKRESIEDDRIGIYRPLMAQMGLAAKLHPDELAYAVLKSGFTTLCFDGQYFFDSDHPGFDSTGAAVSWSNVQAGSAEPWFLVANVGIIKPIIYQKRREYAFMAKDSLDDDNVFFKNEFIYGSDGRGNAGFGLPQLCYGGKGTLDATTYATARKQLASQFNAKGKPLNVMGTLLLVGPANEGAAKTIIEAENQANGATNTWRGTAKLRMTPMLAA